MVAFRFLAVAAALLAPACALTLQSSRVSVLVDDAFPRPLNYTLTSTGEALQGALTGWGFHILLQLNKGQGTCGEAGMDVSYAANQGLPGSDSRAYTLVAACALNWAPGGKGAKPRARAAATFFTLNVTGTVSVYDDPAVPGAGVFSFVISAAELSPPDALGTAGLRTIDIAGYEALSLRALPPVPGCFYTPDMNGVAPTCGGDNYYVDSWFNNELDEWWSATWNSGTETGTVDINTMAGGFQSCMDGASSRLTPGPYSSIVAGGWSHSGHTGAAVLPLTQKHAPLWTGPRAYDLPSRCSTFTVAPSTIYASFPCGSGLPYELRVGVFPDLTNDGGRVSSDDIFLWRRMQYPRADLLYRTTLPYKLFQDGTAYTADQNWNRISFAEAGQYVANLSLILDAYPQTTILVGWQGIGHDTLYPAWDVVNERLGGSAALQALVASVPAVSGSNRSSISYHVNADEAYSLYNGAPNAEFDVRICRVQVDHMTPWFRNGSLGDQTPNYGMRCSISKTKDNVLYGRYTRYARFFDAVPAGTRTIHSDAWRDVGISWEPMAPQQGPGGSLPGGFLTWADEEFCGQRADSAFWASHGMSMGVEGEDGQAQEFAGTVSYEYHADGWDPQLWGRVVAGSSLGYDEDVDCANPGDGKCGWDNFADSFYTGARVYQLALTEELLGETPDGSLRFSGGGEIRREHTLTPGRRRPAVRARTGTEATGDVPQPSKWPYGGDTIPIVDGFGGYLLPLLLADGATLDPDTLHAYQVSAGVPPPDPNCPLFQTPGFLGANNTALADYGAPDYTFNIELPENQASQGVRA